MAYTPRTPKEIKTQEEVETIKEMTAEVVQAEAKPQEASTPVIALKSEIDSYIFERVKEQPKTLAEVEVIADRKYSEATNLLALPTELEKYQKQYSFRWINKKKRSIDRAVDVIGWNFVTLNYFKDLPKRLFTANGVIERGDAILTFIPARKAEQIRLRPAEISRERVRNTPVQDLRKWEDRGDKYYKPDLGAAENDNEQVRGIVVSPDNVQDEATT